MTLVFMVLAIAASIGWTLHARTLRRALHKDVAPCPAQGVGRVRYPGKPRADRRASGVGAESCIDDLLAKFDTKPFTRADYQRERAELERRFMTSHGTHAEDIDIAIRRGILLCNDPLVEEWVELQALAPYVSAENA